MVRQDKLARIEGLLNKLCKAVERLEDSQIALCEVLEARNEAIEHLEDNKEFSPYIG